MSGGEEMSKLARTMRGLKFDADDARAMDEEIRKLDAYAMRTEFPAPALLDYTPILSLALLKSQATLEKLTWCLIGLSCVLAVFAVVQVLLIFY